MMARSGPTGKRFPSGGTTPEPSGNQSGTISREVVPGGGRDPFRGSPRRNHLALEPPRRESRQLAERTRSNNRTDAWYVEPWQRTELPDNEDRQRFRDEKARSEARRAEAFAPILAEAREELERALAQGIITTRGGRRRKGAHMPRTGE
jgi:hypothetical protein